MRSKRAAVLLGAISAVILWLSSGCLIEPHGHRGHYRRQGYHSAPRARRCPPSHFYNGRYCEHKGRGRGARKHDY